MRVVAVDHRKSESAVSDLLSKDAVFLDEVIHGPLLMLV